MDTDTLDSEECKILCDLLNVCAKTQLRKLRSGFKLDDINGRYLKYHDYFDYSLNSFNEENTEMYELKNYVVVASIMDKVTNTYVSISRLDNSIIICFDSTQFDNFDDIVSMFSLAQTEYHGYRVDDAFLHDYLTVRDQILKFFNDSKSLGINYTKLFITGFSIGAVYSSLLLIDLLYYKFADAFKDGIFISLFSSIRFLHPKSADLLNEEIEKHNIVLSHISLNGDNSIYYPPKDYIGLTVKKVRKYGRSLFYPAYCKCKYGSISHIMKITPTFNKKPESILEDRDDQDKQHSVKSVAVHNIGLLYTMLSKMI